MTAPRRVAVFCGAALGNDPAFAEAAGDVGRLLAQRGATLVYGGGSSGLMGTVADAALAAGGRVVGVIPRFLVERELAHPGLDELVVCESLSERKALLLEGVHAALALPGGAGTLDELFDAWTWTILARHVVPCGVLDVAGCWAPLRAQVDALVRDGFVGEGAYASLLFDDDAARLLVRLEAWLAPRPRWAT